MIGYAQTLAPAPTAAAPQVSPDTIALQRAYAKQLLAGSDQPIHSWSQGLAGIVDALVGGTMARKAGERETAGTKSANDEFIQMLTGGAGASPSAEVAAAPPSPPPDGGMWGGALDAIAPAASGPVGAAPAVSPPAAAGAPAISGPQIAALMSNPYASPAQKAMALELWKAQHPTPAAPEPYTLKPGEHRFMGGQEVASVPEAAPEKWVDLPPDANGAVYQRSEKTGELREGIKGSTPGDKWIDLPPDGRGNILQRNERTGETRVSVPGDVKSPAAFDQAKALAEAGRTQVTTNVGSTGIDYGKPPEGYAWVRDEKGNVVADKDGLPTAKPYPGGPAAQAASDVEAKKADAAAQAGTYADVVTEDVDRALDAIGKNPGLTTGAGGVLTGWVPGSKSFDTGELIKTIKSNVGFDRLQQMRAASPTGGALGAVSDFENQLLQVTIGSLSQAQSPDQLKYNLQRVKEIYTAIVNKGIKPGDPLATPQAKASAPGEPSREDIEAEMRRRGLMK